VASPSRPADRYGDRPRSATVRRRLIVAFVAFAAAVMALAAWAAVERYRTGISWIELGLTARDETSATLTFQVSMPAGRTAVCTVRAVNEGLAEVGRQDITVGPSQEGSIRVTATIKTSERASAGSVKTCIQR